MFLDGLRDMSVVDSLQGLKGTTSGQAISHAAVRCISAAYYVVLSWL